MNLRNFFDLAVAGVAGAISLTVWHFRRDLHRELSSVQAELAAERARTEELAREAEAARQQASKVEDDWERTLDALPDPIAILDRQFRVVRANKAMAGRLALTPAACQGLTCYRAVHQMSEPPPFCPHFKMLADGLEHTSEVHEERLGGDFLVSVSPLYDSGGQVVGSIHVARDITERKQAEAEREGLLVEVQRRAVELDGVIATIGVGVTLHDRDGQILRANPEARRLLGLLPEKPEPTFAELVEPSRWTTLDGQPCPAEAHPISRALSGETIRGNTLGLNPAVGQPTPEAEPVWVTASTAPIRTADGRVLGAVAGLTDITALRALQRRQEDLLSTVSHDLRTPLTIVLGQAQLLELDLARRGFDKTETRALRAIESAAWRMSAMIEDLVDSARLEAGAFVLQPVPLDLLAFSRDLKERLDGALDVRRIEIEAPAEPLEPVEADPDRLERILTNLLSNALKYSPSDRKVTLRLTREAEQPIVSVIDRGPGIAAAELPRLFGRYYRTSEGRERKDSVGLGLYITRLLVEAHGGRIWVESEQGSGTAFHFALRRRRSY